MIILDTNVISEPIRPRPNRTVSLWLDQQVISATYTTATSVAELLLGIEILPEGRKKLELSERIRHFLNEYIGPRVLPFDAAAARVYPVIVGNARLRGLTIAVPDGQIAAVAAQNGFSVATRDTTPFLAAGVSVIDPWQTPTT